MEKNQSFDSAIGQNGHLLENGHFWENGNFATNLHAPHLLSSAAMRQIITVSHRIMGQKMDILEMSILAIAPETFETTFKNTLVTDIVTKPFFIEKYCD
jgi:hypothetical protein